MQFLIDKHTNIPSVLKFESYIAFDYLVILYLSLLKNQPKTFFFTKNSPKAKVTYEPSP